MRVDVHHHAIFPSYATRLADRGIGAQPGIYLPSWTPEASIGMMDRLGLDVAVLSVGSPGFYFDGDQAFATSLCAETNDHLAHTARAHPGRFAALVALPLPSGADALAELERTAGLPEFVGVGALTNYDGRYLGDSAFDDVLHALDDLGATVHVHPQLPKHWPEAEIELRPSLLEYVFDSTRAAVNLMLHGVPDRFPRIRWIFSHCGGTAPYLGGRLAIAEPLPELAHVGERGVWGTLRSYHYDIALSTTPIALGGLRDAVGLSQLLVGSDFPFVDEATVTACLTEAQHVLGDGFAEIAAVNPLTLFPKLAGLRP